MGNCLLNAGLTLLCLLPMCCALMRLAIVCIFPYSRRSDNPALARASVSIREQNDGKKIGSYRKREESQQGGEERRMMKNKANASVAATGQRSISLLLLQGLVDGGKDKGWAKEMLCLSLHWLLIYLCPILGNPCSRRLEAKASNQAVCPKRIHYLR